MLTVATSNVQAIGVALVFVVILFVAVAPSPRELERGVTVHEISDGAPDDLRPYVGGPSVGPGLWIKPTAKPSLEDRIEGPPS